MSTRLHRRYFIDRLAAAGVRTAGLLVIASILLIVLFITFASLPLWRSVHIEVVDSFDMNAQGLSGPASAILQIGCDEHRRIGYAISANGGMDFFELAHGISIARATLHASKPDSLSTVWQPLRGKWFAAGTATGRVLLCEIHFAVPDSEGSRQPAPSVGLLREIVLDPLRRPLRQLAIGGDLRGKLLVAGLTADDRVLACALDWKSIPASGSGHAVNISQLPLLEHHPTQIALSVEEETLFVGCANGALMHYGLHDLSQGFDNPADLQTGVEPIQSLSFLTGGRSLLVGDAAGRMTVYFSVPDPNRTLGRRWQRAHELPPLEGAIAVQIASPRNRTYLAASIAGDLGLFFSTTERVLFHGILSQAPIRRAAYAPKADGLVLLDGEGRLYNVEVRNPHPEASWKAFFQKVWYEGYERPEYVWQSAGGTDDVEAKLSFIPLIAGTLKGTFYALLFAVPFAILMALYVSQFMHPRWRELIKPAVELMAALPSVVLGFFAALWLAPRLEQAIPAILFMLVLLPALTLAVGLIAGRNLPGPQHWTSRGHEVLILLGVLAAGAWMALQANDAISRYLFNGDFKQWLLQTMQIHYDQRNALVVSLAMGFAVSPLLFSISEEALSNVPSSLRAASLALGATSWTTAWRVVLPTASPGILAALLIGFGRAVGETMIVLMATGNTPMVDFSIFNGLRSLAANLAVELPEAPVYGTLYRTLFLSALLLFCLSIAANTLAEFVRARMRQRYARL